MADGHLWRGLFLFAYGLIAVSGANSVMRPYFIARGAQLPFLLTLLGVLGGAVKFGLLGVFVGPVLLGVGFTLVREWAHPDQTSVLFGPARGGVSATRHANGVAAEDAAAAALVAEGWTVLARRVRTPAGEVDMLAERDGLLALVEVKRRASLAEAAYALGPRQRARLLAAAEVLLGANPGLGARPGCAST